MKAIPPPFVPRVHDYDKEIRNASKMAKTYDEVITREEANDPLPPKNKKQNPSPPNWDQDF